MLFLPNHWPGIFAVGAASAPVEPLPTLSEGVAFGLVALAVYLALVVCAHLLRRSRQMHFGRVYHLFALCAALLGGFDFSQWQPAWRAEALENLWALTIMLATFPVIGVLNRLLWTRVLPDGRRADAPRLLADTTGLVAFLAMGVVVLESIYQVHIPATVLAGSSVVAFIVGFAMQDLLGNIFAGFALYVSKPFKIGDWLLVDTHHARVLEVTWRSTRLLTDDDVVLEVPNSDLVKRPIINFHQPNPSHALRATIGLHYEVPPAQALAVLKAAAASVPGVCAEPAPSVCVNAFADSAVVYEVKFWITDHAIKSRVLSDVRAHCWYAVRRAGMEIPFPTVTLLQPGPRDTSGAARAAAAAALRKHEIFSFLSEAQVNELLEHSPVELYAPDELLVEQGSAGSSMFLLVRGRTEVRVTHEGKTHVVSHLGPGECLGEMSALTGEKRSATVAAREEVEAVEITHAAFSLLIQHNPEVLNRLGDLLARRQAANEQRKSTNTPIPTPPEEMREGAMRRLRAFFELGH
jgi:small-conductance mechanosensitive channel/CRP-like cAMP-binding protein